MQDNRTFQTYIFMVLNLYETKLCLISNDVSPSPRPPRFGGQFCPQIIFFLVKVTLKVLKLIPFMSHIFYLCCCWMTTRRK